MKRTWSAILLCLAVAACESPSAWSEELVIESRSAQTAADSATVEGATGGVVVHGVYRAPAANYTLRAYYDLSGDEVTLNVGGYPPASGITLPAIEGMGYRITIPLDAGTYTVRVMHHDQGTGDPNARNVAATNVVVGRN
jgi:uncharacterized protein (DUF2141 family)